MVKINLKVTGLEITPAIRDYVDKKLEKVSTFIGRYQDEIILRVEIGKTTAHHQKGDIFRAEIQTHLFGKDFRAVAERDDLYVAIDEVRDEIMSEITHAKDKSETLVKRGGRHIKNILRGFYRGK